MLFSGRVQGVGFRYTTCQIARDFPITGYVRNLPDGRVEAVAEGAVATVDDFYKRLSNEMAGHIRNVVVQDEPAAAQYAGFSVRY